LRRGRQWPGRCKSEPSRCPSISPLQIAIEPALRDQIQRIAPGSVRKVFPTPAPGAAKKDAKRLTPLAANAANRQRAARLDRCRQQFAGKLFDARGKLRGQLGGVRSGGALGPVPSDAGVRAGIEGEQRGHGHRRRECALCGEAIETPELPALGCFPPSEQLDPRYSRGHLLDDGPDDCGLDGVLPNGSFDYTIGDARRVRRGNIAPSGDQKKFVSIAGPVSGRETIFSPTRVNYCRRIPSI
jgi:hypothetical protein